MAGDSYQQHQPFFIIDSGINCAVYEGFQGYENFQVHDGFINYEDYLGNEPYNNAYGNYSGGYGPHAPLTQNIPVPLPPFYGLPDFQGPPGPPREPPINNIQPRFQSDFCRERPPMKRYPTEDRAINSLIRCGFTRDIIRILPRDLIKLYQQDNCGLCSQNLDTLALARLHYQCKNHLKKQKKWITQKYELSSLSSREHPLRARELYCELCDVHITSKAHSESHYSGRPHRSIVEGRKVPKNPFLLQKGLEERLDLLIRREKKHLKAEEEQEKEKKEVKTVPSELYCEICNSSVTCSEQMVMHLNGKRHLLKEKQHILRMMKGDDGGEKEDEAVIVVDEEEVGYDFEDGEANWEDFLN